MRPTKIVCTIGPASRSAEMIERMARAGMDCARLNFSHGTRDDHREVIDRIRRLEVVLNRPIGVIMDLAGPKIRVGDIGGNSIQIVEGQTVVLIGTDQSDTRDVAGDGKTIIPIAYPPLAREVKVKDRIFIADGTIELSVQEITGDRVVARVVEGGTVTSRKGVNFPDTALSARSLTEKDEEDLAFGLAAGVDWVSVSFVRSAEDIKRVKELIASAGKKARVIAKIEKAEAVADIAAIINAADGLMIARGDLGVETPLEEVPLVQKRLIDLANTAGKPVITATQMLESMVTEQRPTRAEVADVANAVIDGTDAVMLSEETAVGKNPALVVTVMARIAAAAVVPFPERWSLKTRENREGDITRAVCHAAYHMSQYLDAAAVITPTSSGTTPRLLAHYKPRQPVIALSGNIGTVRQLTLTFGVIPRQAAFTTNVEDMTRAAREEAIKTGLVKKGDLVVITAGLPGGKPGTTNLIKAEVL
jgi:pyruvate kinase